MWAHEVPSDDAIFARQEALSPDGYPGHAADVRGLSADDRIAELEQIIHNASEAIDNLPEDADPSAAADYFWDIQMAEDQIDDILIEKEK